MNEIVCIEANTNSYPNIAVTILKRYRNEKHISRSNRSSQSKSIQVPAIKVYRKSPAHKMIISIKAASKFIVHAYITEMSSFPKGTTMYKPTTKSRFIIRLNTFVGIAGRISSDPGWRANRDVAVEYNNDSASIPMALEA